MEQGGHARAVFVDPTGRRHRLVVRTAWLLAGLGAAYVALVVVSLLLPPSLSRLAIPGLGPVLPGPAAAPLGQAEGAAEPADVLLERSPSPRRSSAEAPGSPAAVGSTPHPGATGTPPPAAPATTAPAPAPTAGLPTSGPTRRATAAPSAPPGQSAAPGQSQPPGQADRSPQPRRTPSRGPR